MEKYQNSDTAKMQIWNEERNVYMNEKDFDLLYTLHTTFLHVSESDCLSTTISHPASTSAYLAEQRSSSQTVGVSQLMTIAW